MGIAMAIDMRAEIGDEVARVIVINIELMVLGEGEMDGVQECFLDCFPSINAQCCPF